MNYSTREGDIWSLGVILVNLVCGRNPWRIASPSDESFNAFLKDPNFLRRILPISEQCLFVLTQIFTVDPNQRISLRALRKLVLEVETFTMDEEELRFAHAAAQSTTTTPATTFKPSSPLCQLPEINEPEDWAEETVLIFDDADADQETPSLRADSGSPSPPAHRSRSGSSQSHGCSLPPTPLLGAKDTTVPVSLPPNNLWELFKQPNPSFHHRREPELKINPTSPDTLSATAPNPFFR